MAVVNHRNLFARTIAVLLALPLLYFLSSGPALRYVSRAHNRPTAIKKFYDPLLHSPALRAFHESYLELWGVSVIHLDTNTIHEAVPMTATP